MLSKLSLLLLLSYQVPGIALVFIWAKVTSPLLSGQLNAFIWGSTSALPNSLGTGISESLLHGTDAQCIPLPYSPGGSVPSARGSFSASFIYNTQTLGPDFSHSKLWVCELGSLQALTWLPLSLFSLNPLGPASQMQVGGSNPRGQCSQDREPLCSCLSLCHTPGTFSSTCHLFSQSPSTTGDQQLASTP